MNNPNPISGATELYIAVPHNSGDNEAHNVVTVGPAEYDQEDGVVRVTFVASNPGAKSQHPVDIDGEAASVTIREGEGDAGGVDGLLTATTVGTNVVVTFSGTITGWNGYGFTPYIKFPSEQPLLIAAFPASTSKPRTR